MMVNPDEFKLEVDCSLFNLRRKRERPKVLIASDTGWNETNLETLDNYFEDSVRGSSLVIEQDLPTKKYKVSGTLDLQHIILPIDNHEELHSEAGCDNCLNVFTHMVLDAVNDDNDASDMSDYEQVKMWYPRARRGKSLMKKIYLEILILADYFLLKKLNFDQAKMTQYIVSFMNAVNLRFHGIDSPRIEIFIAGIVIGKTKSAFSFLSENIEKKDRIDAASTLHSMGKYFYKERLY